ncbi:putative Late nodulin [Medicago truncatula]|uniref:Nodule Cysteine-Rich (NCR) secreted peptide n=1 Tax=Medicago truncatula TaxID=3880 RepID=G7IX58_MEDTR|nr:Nodule Cysteine-Rich (NCR) secreted peptide [Medicago truncatula]RHN66370.1 putative Late nodulin [Medicago truncatula]
MAKIFKFVYVMIIIISLLLVAMNAQGYCLVDADCVTLVCNFDEKRKCLRSTCVCRKFRFTGFYYEQLH